MRGVQPSGEGHRQPTLEEITGRLMTNRLFLASRIAVGHETNICRENMQTGLPLKISPELSESEIQ